MNVYLNVYDVVHYNKYTSYVGLGIYHTCIEIERKPHLGHEFSYGYNFNDEHGINMTRTRHWALNLKEKILLGVTSKSREEICEILGSLEEEFKGNNYHLLLKNCNHFSDSFAKLLVGKGIPPYVNRVSEVGHCLSCFCPASIWDIVLDEKVPLKKKNFISY